MGGYKYAFGRKLCTKAHIELKKELKSNDYNYTDIYIELLNNKRKKKANLNVDVHSSKKRN